MEEAFGFKEFIKEIILANWLMRLRWNYTQICLYIFRGRVITKVFYLRELWFHFISRKSGGGGCFISLPVKKTLLWEKWRLYQIPDLRCYQRYLKDILWNKEFQLPVYIMRVLLTVTYSGRGNNNNVWAIISFLQQMGQKRYGLDSFT